MKSYFSQLVKQSGLPTSVAGKNAGAEITSLKDKQRNQKEKESVKPLHREETIFTSSAPSPVRPEDRSSQSKDKTISSEAGQTSPEIRSENPSSPEREVPQDKKSKFAEVSNSHTDLSETDSLAELSKTEVLAEEEKIVSSEEPLAGQKTDAETKESGSAKEVSQPRREILRESPGKTIEEETSVSASTAVPATEIDSPDTAATEYFKQTSRILEEGKNSPREIQQVFLQEIQQWVADPSALEKQEPSGIEEKKTVESSLSKESKTVVVRKENEGEKRKADVGLTEEHQPHQPTEQNLNLSIGTISIVVEEAEDKIPAPVENLAKQSAATNKTSKNERKFSRLSRHYL